MKKTITICILSVVLLLGSFPLYSFAGTTDETSALITEQEDLQTQESEPITCEADINPALRETVINNGRNPTLKSSTNTNIVELRKAAHTKVRMIMDSYADVDYYRSNNYDLTSDQKSDAIAVAEEATAGLTSDYDKMLAIYELVAENIYYDYDYYLHVTSSTNQYYDVWTTKVGVCTGYAQLCTIFLNSLNIPCIYLMGEAHVYNAAYDSQSKRWVFFDATWGSKNSYSNGEKTYKGHNNDYFDMSVSKIAGLTHHEVFTDIFLHDIAEGGNVKYYLSMPGAASSWHDMTLWDAIVYSPENKSSETITVGLSELEGFPVSIGHNAFRNCTSTSKVFIPEGIKGIESYAFCGCSSLTDISIPESVTSISSDVFCGCSSLKDVSIPETVTSIGDNAFRRCISLTDIAIPKNVTSIGNNAFDGCSNLTEISVPDGVTIFSVGLFNGCSSLRDISIPETVTSIGESAFRGCSSLKDISIPETVTSIGDSAFRGCTGLTEVCVPGSVNAIGANAFDGCSGLKSFTVFDGTAKIGSYALRGCSNVTSITFPDSVTQIGSNAFRECIGLKSFSIPEGVTEIAAGTFYGCSSLTNVTIPEGVTNIGDSAFYGCNSISKITLPSGVTSIGEYTFWYCRNLNNIIIPEGVTSIKKYAFNGCSGLTDITLSSCLTTIESSAFSKCTSLSSIIIPEGTRKIGDNAFNGCSSLKKVTMPESMDTIGNSAFSGCSSLIDFAIPKGVSAISSRLFYNCNSLRKVVIPDDVISIDASSFTGCNGALCIYCNRNSYAHSFAVDNEIDCKFFVPLSDCIISLNKEEYQTTGKPIKPSITVKDGEVVLTEGIHYSVSESDANLGEVSATVTGLDIYTGEVIIHFTITDHQWADSYTVDKQPTCVADGVESIHCIVCGAVKEGTERKIDKTGHKCSEWHLVSAATCTEDGKKEGICTVCNESVIEPIPATGHEWNPDYTVDKYASCTLDGVESIHCANCDAKKNEHAIPAAGHSFGDWCTVESSTCEAAGSQQRICSVCGLTELKDLDPDGHDWDDVYTTDVPATCITDGSQSIHCKKCDARKESTIIPATGQHDIIRHEGKAPTCTDPGHNAYETCSYCDYTTYQEMPALGHSWVNAETPAGLLKNGSKYEQCITCGARQNLKVIAGYAKSYVKSFKVSKGKKSFIAKWQKQSKTNQKAFSGYQIRYSKYPDMSGSKYKTASKSSKSKKVKGLSRRTTYYVQVRTYTKTMNGTFYSSWTAKKAVKTR